MSTVPRYIPHYTIDDYAEWEGDWELIDGVAISMGPSPFGPHERIISRLSYQIQTQIEKQECGCEVYTNLDWIISDDTVIRPDLMVICGVQPTKHLERPPELVVEVLSDSTRGRDLTAKRALCRENNVTHYLIVAPQAKAVAEKAKDALLMQLSGRLMAVMQSDGPVAAIGVCSEQAVTIAETVGKEYGVEIGRTSFKLRNPTNAPRDWVKPFVENRTDTLQYVQIDDGKLGALFPIHLKVKCLMCHGQPEDILDAVKPELAKLYPNDTATGFKLDELRGWFWVEVPSPN